MRQAGVHTFQPRIQPRHAIQWLTLLAMGVAVGMLALGGAILVDSRADAWRQAEHASNNLELALTRDIERNVMLYDLSLQGVIEAMNRPDIDKISPETRQMTLFDRAATAEYLGALLVLDADGTVIADSTTMAPRPVNLSDREHFKVHQQRADVGLFISRPFKSRLRADESSIAISRRISRPDGSFGGVVTGAMRLDYFKDLFAKLELGSNGSVTLFRSDGRVIMRRPYNPSVIDSNIGQTPAARIMAGANAGTMVREAAIDGVKRLYTFRHLHNLPLILTVGVAVDDIYAVWWRKALGIGAVLLLLCGATIVLCLLFRRELIRRMEAETRLRDAADQLAILAATDGLTGLANRRAFDERLSQEWNRAIRSETPVALLMMDADLFKSYNDRYGHVEGDQVLRSIALCIARSALRPYDNDARYGGEEFAVLLSETEISGAVVVAERIRSAVAELGIPHDGSLIGHVTISIGVAVVRPRLGDPQTLLVERADSALYDAKHAGRNRVCVSGWEDALLAWDPASPERWQAD